MHTWTLPHLYRDENGVSRVDPNFSQELTAVEFAPPAPAMLISPVAQA